jgi:hypothetical protein
MEKEGSSSHIRSPKKLPVLPHLRLIPLTPAITASPTLIRKLGNLLIILIQKIDGLNMMT